MRTISAQISIYPLCRRSIGKVIESSLSALHTHDVEVSTGPTSTVVVGAESQVFGALRAAFETACLSGDAVLVATISNACHFEPVADQTAPGD